MMDIEKLLDEYRERTTIRRSGEYVFVTPPFFHLESDDSIALRFSEKADGRPVLTDCGTTKDYLDIREISLKKYREKLDAIMKRFGIKEENGAFVMEMPTNSPLHVERNLGCFIQAISIIANIDL